MTTPSGQISLDDVNTELDISPGTQINMNASAVRTLAEVPTGAIGMSDLQGKSNAQFVVASGGSTSTQGDFKIHVFNSGGTFTVNQAGNAAGSNQVEYMVVAGGGGGGAGRGGPENPSRRSGGSGGGGGFREAKNPAAPFPASPLVTNTLIPVTATNFPISVGGGGAGGAISSPKTQGGARGDQGSTSSFSNISSAGGGGGSGTNFPNANAAQAGGS